MYTKQIKRISVDFIGNMMYNNPINTA